MKNISRLFVSFMVLVLAAGLLSGCTSSAPVQETKETAAAVSVSAEEPEEEAVLSEEPEKEAVPSEEPEAEDMETAEDDGPQGLPNADAAYSAVTGDAVEVDIPENATEISEGEVEEMERMVRDYKPPKKTLVINKAKKFYYYEKLKKGEKGFYDALYTVARDPGNKDCVVKFKTKYNPAKETFLKKYRNAYISMLFDHPELFWLYNSKDLYFQWVYYRDPDANGKYTVFFQLNKPLQDYKKIMKEFNKAAKSFLKAIDLNANELDISWQIHDRLINTVSYNHPVRDRQLGYDLAHTAYGALVADSSGISKYAVCDGYSFAYLYLMQQAGLQAVFLQGFAGSPSSQGRHAWNMARLGGKWYEIDVTWDDFDTVDTITSPDNQPFYDYVNEALHNKAYMEVINHYMYALSTKKIRNFYTSDIYKYDSADGKYWVNLVGDSVHIRESEYGSDTAQQIVIKRAPTAK